MRAHRSRFAGREIAWTFAALLLASTSLSAHPSVSVVVDAHGNVYYSDLARVWMVAPDGRRTVAVPDVHTHELHLDAEGNLYGEHVWYEGDATKKWGHRVWRRSPSGAVTDVYGPREGFRSDYSFVRDASGNMYSAVPGPPAVFRRRAPDGNVATVALCRECRNVRWLAAADDGTLYFTDGGELREVSPAGRIRTLARGLAARRRNVPPAQDWRVVMGIWTDAERNVYVASFGERAVQRVSPDGRVAVVARSRFPWAPTGGRVAPNGDLWILEWTLANAVRLRRVERPAAAPAESAIPAALRADCARILDGATAGVDSAVRTFEAAPAGSAAARAAGQSVATRARRAREVLEGTPVAHGCVDSKGEELVYLNHLVLGFEAWLAAGARHPPAEYDVASIVRRARVHRERGRARLR